MTPTVVDASAIVAALIDDGPPGRWAEELLDGRPLAAPHLLPAEVTNIIRRATLAGHISPDIATLAQHDLNLIAVELYPYEPFAARVWQLRTNVTAYDAWYVALAEHLAAPLATLDRQLAATPGPACRFELPPS